MNSYAGSSRHSSASPTNSRASSTKSSATSRSTADHQNLLAPVVRSKRTPIACTECRRRQVKCTGTTPKCERCEKRGMKCEYIPCSQQKAATKESSPPQTLQSTGISHHPHTRQYSLDQYSSSQWQQPYDAPSFSSLGQQVDWQGHPAQRAAIPQQSRYSSVQGIHMQSFDGSPYNQASYSSQQPYTSSMASGSAPYAQRPTVPSHSSYGGMPTHSGYMATDVGIGNDGLNYSYANVGQPMGNTFVVPSTHPAQSYPREYYHADTDTFDPTAVGMVSGDPSHPYGDFQRPY